MSTITLEELGKNTAGLLDRLVAGETVMVVRGGRAVAELRPVPDRPYGPRPFGLCAGAFTVPDDFDSPLPEETLREFERE
ncbi:MAG: type II toxin-antitoxin system Phd/YefM family antitoxin [Pirellulaceae bacterium]